MKDFTVDFGGLKVVAITWAVIIVFVTALVLFPMEVGAILVIVLTLILVVAISYIPYMMYMDNKKWKSYANDRYTYR